ncbi:hypothetical protein FALBO_15232 [Fusarium albosuccineum]|uniref:NmrA-like domain-containing protein n=1 Tax=Fusarium albosuccineum TaxID=1237068 RepID=A0A8H4PE81_9HYPO|nr:hypothetical protein FALBO_15232 [Fusarium albosuccineum]
MATPGKIHDVVVTGPSGVLGPATISELLTAGFNVTAVTRDPERARPLLPSDIRIVKGDYSSVETLTPALSKTDKPFDAMVCLLDRQQTEAQMVVTAATVAAGIPHIIPSCFGLGERHLNDFRHFPPISAKRKVLDDIRNKADQGIITHTTIHAGAILDWALDRGIFVNLEPGQPTRLLDGGNVPTSATLTKDIAKAIAAALLKKQETVNKTLQINTAVITSQQLLSYARQAVPDREFPTINMDTAQAEKGAWDMYEAGQRDVTVDMRFLARANTLAARMDPIDNELLGIRMMSEDEIKDEILSRINKRSP